MVNLFKIASEKKYLKSGKFFEGSQYSVPVIKAIENVLFKDNILSIGQTEDNDLYLEYLEDNHVVQVLYNDSAGILQLHSKTTKIKIEISSVMFVPIFLNEIIIKKNKTIIDNSLKLKSMFPANTTVLHTTLFKNIYEEFVKENNNKYYVITNEAIIQDVIKIKKDYTEEITGKKGAFLLKKDSTKAEEIINAKIPNIKFEEMSEEMKLKIPVLPKWMAMPKKLIPVAKSLSAGRAISMLQYGPAGGGKTTNVKIICRDIQLPLMAIVNCTNNLDEFILGKYIPLGKEFVFQKSEVTEAIEKGGAVVFEEINYGNPKYMSFLNSLLDENGFVRLDNGEVIKRHKNFRFFATMNYGYAGTSELSKALYNRFQSKVRIDDLDDEQINRLISNNSKVCSETANDLIFIYRKIQKKLKEEEREEIISPRDIVNWAIQAQDSNIITAAEYTVCAIAENDNELYEEILDIVKMKF